MPLIKAETIQQICPGYNGDSVDTTKLDPKRCPSGDQNLGIREGIHQQLSCPGCTDYPTWSAVIQGTLLVSQHLDETEPA
ncbi:hypothetical protein A2397_04755 [Candidatus Amesbacteria bacterium RIFOXYB1_FULL_44_23]|uniref:Uncharacterized protein n=1 Tax=Candidatus Amesbacteria bacterium RIFOXYB1_FULL_44_23 TaxID=1797263 RepID=A0A1F4ZUA0_9BACT|nr:MAG: hypothetical protein A2397_04755 [Candidatus Amesbacteria bacterium RIFOXYB1_FULL_44_23]